MNRTRTLLALAALALVVPAAAEARPAQGRGGVGSSALSGWLVLDPGPIDGVGLGGRLTFPIIPGVIQHPRIRDEFVLEPGIDYVHYEADIGWGPYRFDYSWSGLLFVVGGAWNIWLSPQLALYPKIDLGYWYGWYSGWDDRWGADYGYGNGDFGGLFIQAAGGLVYRLDRAQLRLELGSGLLRVGAGVSF